MMTNLTHSVDDVYELFNQKNCPSNKENTFLNNRAKQVKTQKNFAQKSVIGSRMLKFNSQPNQVLGMSDNFKGKISYQTDCSNDFLTIHAPLINSSNENCYESVKPRKIPQNPYKIFEAPGLCDDFYLNLVDWSPQNVLAVALESQVIVWNATTSQTKRLCNLGDHDQVTSLSWSNNGNYLSVGTRSGKVDIWDISVGEKVRTMGGHDARVSSLAWNNNMQSVMASGSKDKTILVRDLRQQTNGYMRLMEHR